MPSNRGAARRKIVELEAAGKTVKLICVGRKARDLLKRDYEGLISDTFEGIGKKGIEEAGETVIAAKNGVPAETIHEVADLWFHSLVLLSASGLTPADVWQELRSRRK